MPYGKGAVIVYYLDKRLTEISNGKYSMDDVLKYFFKRWKEKRLGFSYYEFFNYLEKLGGKEFVKEAREIIEKYNDLRVLRMGYTYRILTNDANIVDVLEEKLRNVKPRVLKLEARRISLGDVYFLLTGVVLK